LAKPIPKIKVTNRHARSSDNAQGAGDNNLGGTVCHGLITFKQ
jgi:hypothetical protein